MILLILTIIPSVVICNKNAITFKRNVFFDSTEHLEESICFTAECVQTASRIRSWMNETADPCNDFHNFVCGSYSSNIDTHNNKQVSPFTTLNDKITRQIVKILQEDTKDDELRAFKIAKKMYKKCYAETTEQGINQSSIKASQNTISSIEQWPLLNGTQWDKESWSWINAIQKLRRMGLPYGLLFELSLIRDQRDTSKILLKLDAPQIYSRNINLARIHILQELLLNFSSSQTSSNTTIKDYLGFEEMLIKASNVDHDSVNSSSLYTVKKLQLKFNYMNWIEIIEMILDNGVTLKKETEIFMNNIPYFTELRKILKRTPKRTIANYFFLKTLMFMTRHNLQLSQKAIEVTSDIKCASLTKQLLPVSVNALYVRKYFNELPKDAIRIAINMQRQLKRMIKRSDWLDSGTKINALEKLEYMTIQLGYSDDYLNDTKIEKYLNHLKLHENGTLLEDEMVLSLFTTNRRFRQYKKLSKSVPKYADVTTANSLYDINRNAVSIPAALLQGNIFGVKRPNFMNYASFGSIVAHAISSAFSLITYTRDKHGNSVTWWDDDTHQTFLNKTNCVAEQYKVFNNNTSDTIKLVNSLVADMLSMKAAYLSYKDWSKRHSDELGLPFLKFTPNQLFWISLGQNHCNANEVQRHAVESRYRVNGVLRNLIEFSEDFHCKLNSYMNPSVKCEIF